MTTKPKKEPQPQARVTMRLPEPLWKRAQHHAIDEGIELQELVRRALELYLKGEKR